MVGSGFGSATLFPNPVRAYPHEVMTYELDLFSYRYRQVSSALAERGGGSGGDGGTNMRKYYKVRKLLSATIKNRKIGARVTQTNSPS